MIFLYHFSFVSKKSIVLSYTVDIFYILSGFLVAYTSEDENHLKYFLSRKLIKLLPLYYLLTVITFIGGRFTTFLGYTPTYEQLIKSILFIPFLRKARKSSLQISPIMGLGRTLQIEIVFYFIYYISFKLINKKYRNEITIVLLTILFMLPYFYASGDSVYYNYYLIVNRSSWICFIIGILLYYANRTLDYNAKFLFLVLFVAAASLIYNFIILNRYILIIFDTCLLLLALYFHNNDIDPPKKLIQLGDISYSMYLIHYYIVAVFDKLLYLDGKSVICYLKLFCVYFICIIISKISYEIVEKKITNHLMRLAYKEG